MEVQIQAMEYKHWETTPLLHENKLKESTTKIIMECNEHKKATKRQNLTTDNNFFNNGDNTWDVMNELLHLHKA